MALREHTAVYPGYDCRSGICDVRGASPKVRESCQTTSGGNHGGHGDEWWFAVEDGEFALSLTVFTTSYKGEDRFRYTRADGSPVPRARGSMMTGHSVYPPSAESVRSGEAPAKCDWLDRGCYATKDTALGAEEFFAAHGDPDHVKQPTSFWRALKRQHAELKALALRADREWQRCAACDGRGVVALLRVVA